MHWQYTPYTLPLLLAMVAAALLGGFVWRRRSDTPGAIPFAIIQLAAAVWSLGTAMELASVELASKYLWIQVQYLGSAAIPALWLIFVLRYIGSSALQGRRALALLAIEPIFHHLMLWTNEYHHLMYRGEIVAVWQGCRVMSMIYGPWFWIHVAYSYLLLLAGTLVLLPAVWRSTRLYRGQLASILIGALIPWICNILYNFRIVSFPYLDLTPFGFVLMGPALVWGLFRFRLLNVVPIARHAVVEGLDDGVVVLGNEDYIVDVNPAALRFLGCPADALIGQPAERALAHLPALVELLTDEEKGHVGIALGEGEEERICDLHLVPLYGWRRRPAGRVVVLHDISEGRRIDEALIRAQRLSATGELSLGLSHNLNNLLTGILGPAQRLREAGLVDVRASQRLETIISSARRARDLVRRLGMAVREEEERLEPVRVEEAVQEAVQGARPRWQDEAKASGRSIEVESAPGQGSCFELRLPVWSGPLPEVEEEPEVETKSEEEKEEPERQPLRIMMVEDEAITGLVLADALRRDAHQVDSFLSGDEALQGFAPGRYDLVMVDLGIPGIAGDQLARRFKEQDAELAAVLLTGWHLQEGDERLEPFEVYIQKPFEVGRVRRAVYRALELKGRKG